MNIVLIGYRGSGKTTVGKLLAEKLWMDFVDTDQQVQANAQMDISTIFRQHGEAHFRALEAAAVAAAAARENAVIAAGGGAVLSTDNVEALKRNGKIIWLQADPEVLWQRMQADAATPASRPSLTAAGGLEEVRTLLAAREQYYHAAADARLDVTRLEPARVVDYVLQLV